MIMTNGSQPLLELSQTPILDYIQWICTIHSINDVLSHEILFNILVHHLSQPCTWCQSSFSSVKKPRSNNECLGLHRLGLFVPERGGKGGGLDESLLVEIQSTILWCTVIGRVIQGDFLTPPLPPKSSEVLPIFLLCCTHIWWKTSCLIVRKLWHTMEWK